MNLSEQRRRLRAVLAGAECVSPASVYDALTARLAQAAGYDLGILAGSVAAHTTLAAPDLIVLTLTEFADQIRRIKRASDISLLVDADHGYGNALNVMRTVAECEHAGAAAMSLEDTALPIRFRQPEGREELIPLEEMVGKLKAAVAARQDPATVIAGRTAALKVEGTERACERARAYAACGVDCIFVIGVERAEQVRAVREAGGLPVIVGSTAPGVTRGELQAAGARILLQGHQPLAAAVKAVREVYAHLRAGGDPAALKDRIASAADIDALTGADLYRQRIRDWMR